MVRASGVSGESGRMGTLRFSAAAQVGANFMPSLETARVAPRGRSLDCISVRAGFTLAAFTVT
jgi:hypothetical protein